MNADEVVRGVGEIASAVLASTPLPQDGDAVTHRDASSMSGDEDWVLPTSRQPFSSVWGAGA
jgi:hypothetical protein